MTGMIGRGKDWMGELSGEFGCLSILRGVSTRPEGWELTPIKPVDSLPEIEWQRGDWFPSSSVKQGPNCGSGKSTGSGSG